MIWSISGVPRMTHTKVLTTPRSGAHRLMEPKATTRPSGSEKSNVRKNSSQLSANAPVRRSRITVTGSLHLSYYNNVSQSARVRPYLSASACMVPSAFSSSKAVLTASGTSLPLRKATPYSSTFSSSTILRSA